jgi:uncharacterized protein YbaR (Trm112 family)
MLKLKGCPRCNGDLVVNQDRRVYSELCLQCGFEKEHLRAVSVKWRVESGSIGVKST